MNKCKFKQHQHVVAVVNGDNVTQGDVYVVVTPYESTHDIACVSVIGDNGNLAYNYQTVFREAKIEGEEMSVEDAVVAIEAKAEDCFMPDCPSYYFSLSEFITKIQHDKELQKALLVLIGEGK